MSFTAFIEERRSKADYPEKPEAESKVLLRESAIQQAVALNNSVDVALARLPVGDPRAGELGTIQASIRGILEKLGDTPESKAEIQSILNRESGIAGKIEQDTVGTDNLVNSPKEKATEFFSQDNTDDAGDDTILSALHRRRIILGSEVINNQTAAVQSTASVDNAKMEFGLAVATAGLLAYEGFDHREQLEKFAADAQMQIKAARPDISETDLEKRVSVILSEGASIHEGMSAGRQETAKRMAMAAEHFANHHFEAYEAHTEKYLQTVSALLHEKGFEDKVQTFDEHSKKWRNTKDTAKLKIDSDAHILSKNAESFKNDGAVRAEDLQQIAFDMKVNGMFENWRHHGKEASTHLVSQADLLNSLHRQTAKAEEHYFNFLTKGDDSVFPTNIALAAGTTRDNVIQQVARRREAQGQKMPSSETLHASLPKLNLLTSLFPNNTQRQYTLA